MRTQALTSQALNLVLGLMYEPNRLACKVALMTGLRISDVLSLKSADLKKKSFTIIEQKTLKKKVLRLPKSLCEELTKIAGNLYVFEHRTDPTKHRCRQTVSKDIKRVVMLLSEMGYIPKVVQKGQFRAYSINTHSMRKSFVYQALESGVSLDKVRVMLNHDDYMTTLIYGLSDLVDIRTSRRYKGIS